MRDTITLDIGSKPTFLVEVSKQDPFGEKKEVSSELYELVRKSFKEGYLNPQIPDDDIIIIKIKRLHI
jgi:hypothetical protein